MSTPARRARRGLSIRAKTLLLSLLLLAIPYVGYQYVRETERFLRAGLEESVLAGARALAGALHERPALFGEALAASAQRSALYAYPLPAAPEVDGYAADWLPYRDRGRRFTAQDLVEGRDDPGSLQASAVLGVYKEHLFGRVEVRDDRVVYARPDRTDGADAVELSTIQADGRLRRYRFATLAPGRISAVVADDAAERRELRILGAWQPAPGGYALEFRAPMHLLGARLALAVVDVDDPQTRAAQRRLSTSPADTPGRLVLPSAEIDALIRGLGRTPGRRVWVVDAGGRVLASGGSLERAEPAAPASALYALVLSPPSDEALAETPALDRLEGPEVAAALAGSARTRWRSAGIGDAGIVSGAYPVWSGTEVAGAVVVEETSLGIDSVRGRALASLFDKTLGVGLAGALALLVFANRLSARLARLRNEAEAAIDAHGRVTGTLRASRDRDEIGDLSRGFAAMLERLRRYNLYLERLGGRLSHELRTPLAVVRSSLDNLELEPEADARGLFLERARAGLSRLDAIITRMSEAARLEQALQSVEREPLDLCALVRAAAEGYRAAWPGHRFELALPAAPVPVRGAADLLVQMLDKLVANARDFSAPGTPVAIALRAGQGSAVLEVCNRGVALPDAMTERVFDSMVSIRPTRAGDEPHLGLGLHVVRTVAEFHGGQARAENLPDHNGVRMSVTLPLA